MKGTKAVVCPQCGALNRPTWEFCARCNESLEAATAVEESVGPATAVEDDVLASSAPANTIALAGILALVIVGAAAWRTLEGGQPDGAAADPSIFTIARSPPICRPRFLRAVGAPSTMRAGPNSATGVP
jgi:hypothetical protein